MQQDFHLRVSKLQDGIGFIRTNQEKLSPLNLIIDVVWKMRRNKSRCYNYKMFTCLHIIALKNKHKHTTQIHITLNISIVEF